MAAATSLFLLFTITFFTTSVADDGAALLALAKSFNPPPSDWSTTVSTGFCKWSGVRCTGAGRVNSISLADKSLSGVIAPEISTLSELKTVSIQRNQLTGKIPSFAKLSSLQEIYMDENLFVGVETGAFAGLTSLQILSLSDNLNLTAWGFPSELSDSTSLTTIYLDNTHLVGVLPDIFDSFASLHNLRLSYNNITGFLPPSLANSPIQNLWIDNQHFGMSGTIEVLSNMTSLSQAWLHKNQFVGSIPDLSKCDILFDLQLRDNQLTGNVPPTLLSLRSLKNISLDNNKFHGPLPLFPPEVKATVDQNGFCTTKAGQSSSPLVMRLLAAAGGLGYPSMLGTNSGASGNNSSSGSSRGGGGNKSHVMNGVIVAVLIFLAILVCAVYIYVRYKKRNPIRRDPENPENSMLGNLDVLNGGDTALNQPSNAADNSIWLQNSRQGIIIPGKVLCQATNNFSDDNILGEGGFGVVYGGEFHNGTKVAIKKMRDPKMVKYFDAEIAVLTKVKHRNLITLLGYCVNGDERFLVYEFMPRGDLGQHLFKSLELGVCPLTWKQRMRIALDVAQGVECLHSFPQQNPIHKDLKPPNILIGNDKRAKVADFGMVKIAVDGNYSIDSRLKGTFGYLAPEYGRTGMVTPKVDVYAFGVILMEMITGRRAFEKKLPEKEQELVKWFHKDLIDRHKLEDEFDQAFKPDEETIETIHKVAKLARDCTTDDPNLRPDMREIVEELKPLVNTIGPRRRDCRH